MLVNWYIAPMIFLKKELKLSLTSILCKDSISVIPSFAIAHFLNLSVNLFERHVLKSRFESGSSHFKECSPCVLVDLFFSRCLNLKREAFFVYVSFLKHSDFPFPVSAVF